MDNWAFNSRGITINAKRVVVLFSEERSLTPPGPCFHTGCFCYTFNNHEDRHKPYDPSLILFETNPSRILNVSFNWYIFSNNMHVRRLTFSDCCGYFSLSRTFCINSNVK